MKKEPESKAEWGPCYSPWAGNHLLAICDSFWSVLQRGGGGLLWHKCSDREVGWRDLGLVVNFDLNISNVKPFVLYNAAISRELSANQNWRCMCQTESSNWWDSVQAQFRVIDRERRKHWDLHFSPSVNNKQRHSRCCVEFSGMIILFGISFLNSSINTVLA